MSLSQESNTNLARYHSVIESLKYVASLLCEENGSFEQIHQELLKCHEKIETLIFEEKTNLYLVALLQLRQLIFEWTRKLEGKTLNKRTVSQQSGPSKPLQNNKLTEEQVQMMIKSTIETPRVNGLKEIAGLWEAKKLLKSLVLLPRHQPQLFDNHKTYNSVLLFGPPGTGKTQLVHAIAYEANATLHCVSVSTMLSSFVGQTEKNMQALFKHIKSSNNFSILFIDEVDGLCRTRQDSEQDYTRRMKTELMCQMTEIENEKNLFLICATNCPWDIDTAFLRRFHKRVYIPLPSFAERHELFELFTKNTSLQINSEYWEIVIERTEGFSGSDLSDLVQSTLNIPIMELEDTKIWKLTTDGFYEPADDFGLEDIYCRELSSLPCGSVRARPVQMLDLLNSLDEATATVSHTDVERYETFITKQ